jgi:DNA-binding LacI/PurR family transcriptional regulator
MLLAQRKSQDMANSHDVARLAGVSQKTVSRVFRGEQHVSEDTRQRVLAAADKLDYRLNFAARTLSSGRTQNIGIVASGTTFYGPATIFTNTERQARNAGYSLQIVFTAEGDAGGVDSAIDALSERGVDGIVILEPIDEGGQGITVDVPLLVFGETNQYRAPKVVYANDGAALMAQAATNYLLNLGHATVHHIAGPQNWYTSQERLAGWKSALEARGVTTPIPLVGDWTAASGYEAGRKLAADDSVTAVFSANDDMAIGLIHALRESGRQVPGDVSVVGLDDSPISAYVTPPLTTLNNRLADYATRAFAELVKMIETDHTGPTRIVAEVSEVTERESAAPPKHLAHPT